MHCYHALRPLLRGPAASVASCVYRSLPSTASSSLSLARSFSSSPALQQQQKGQGGGGKGAPGGGGGGGGGGGKGGGKGAPPAASAGKPPTPAAPSAVVAAPSAAAAPTPTPTPTPAYLPNYGAPTRPEVLRIQLRLKAYHKFYLNRYVFLLARRFQELGLPRPSQAFLPTKRELYTVLRSPHVDKRARDQFERCTHKRVVTFTLPQGTQGLELSYRLLSGVATLTPGVSVRAHYQATGLQGSSI